MLSRKGQLIFGIIGSVLLTLMGGGFALDVWIQIRDGHAADSYENFYGWHVTWGQAAGGLVSVPLILLVIYVVTRWQLWRRARQAGVSVDSMRKHLKKNL